jgi:hypothetical protein
VFNDLKRSLESDGPISSSWLLGQSHLVIGLILIAIGVDPEYKSVSRSLSEWGTKGEPNAPIVTESEAIEADLATGFVHVSYRGRD